MKISATIIAFNEANNIARAVRSLSFADEIVVVDSNSVDNTAQIAHEHGAKVINHPFAGFGQQKNFAADQCEHDWIINIDADEEVSEELKNSILALKSLAKEQLSPIYNSNRRTSFCGKMIYHGGWYPDIIPRFYNKKLARWTEPHVHEKLVPIEPTGSKAPLLKGHLNHYSFPTIESQIRTNIKYAKLGAKDLIKRKGKRPKLIQLFLKPIGKFIECYLLKKGILDGLHGLIIAINAAYSIYMKYSFAYWDDEK